MTLELERAALESARAVESARALWRAGLVPECHAHMTAALRTLVEGWAPVESAETPASDSAPAPTREERALAALERAGYHRVDRLRSALEATAGVGPPAKETSTDAVPRSDFEPAWAEVERLSDFTWRHSMSAATKKKRRVVLVGALGIALVVMAIVGVRLWIRPRVVASAVLGWEFPASYATDGLEATEWLLPDRTTGWVDVIFSSSRTVRRVRVFNVHNRYFADRGSERIRVTAFDDWRPLATAEGRFDGIKAERSVLNLDLPAKGVKRVRVEVLSSFGLGGGVAEVEVE
jgi:hypothetical protein